MYDTTYYTTLHRLASELEREAVEEWAKEVAGGEDLVDALALHARQIETTLTRLQGGNVSVTVSIEARNAWESERYYFPLQKQGNGYLVRGRSPSSLASRLRQQKGA